jgi:hypothetical protein
METKMHLFKKITYYLSNKRFYLVFLFLFLLYGVFYYNTMHEQYPDEFDNILGGKYILKGILPYTGFFSHHGPVPYFISAVITIFSGVSFVRFRILYSIFLFLYLFGTYYFIAKSVGSVKTYFYLFFIVIIGLSSTYFWGHMLIADNIAAYSFIPAFGLLFLKIIYNQRLSLSDITFISLLTFLGVLSSLTFVYFSFIIYALLCFAVLLQHPIRKITKYHFKIIGILIAPFVVFLLYLLLTGSLREYVNQSILFNQRYYIYNYPRPENSTTFNPLRYAIVISRNFFNNYFELLRQAKDFNFAFPFNITLALANLSVVVYLLSRKKFLLTIVFFLLLTFANVRSSPLTSSEKDYQSAVYFLLSFFSLSFILPALYEELNTTIVYGKKIIFTFVFILLSIYAFFFCINIFYLFKERAYAKYMGSAPLIYDRPIIAPVINSITTPTDYAWVGPLEFEELLYMNAQLPSKYHMMIPVMEKSSQIQNDIVAEYSLHKPVVMYFDKEKYILGKNPEEYVPGFVQFISDNYITLYEYREGKIKYVSVPAISSQLDLEKKLYIDKDKKNDIIKKLLQNNLIREVESK